MNPTTPGARAYYVYVLFDAFAVPRYVGKGKGNRWLQHEHRLDPNNHAKNDFIQRTLCSIGEVPKVKICGDLLEHEAFEIEHAMIKAIGRSPKGPLVNRTDKRNGPSSERIRAWHASRTPEQRAATARRTQETIMKTTTPEQRSERARKNALSVGRDSLADRMRKSQAGRSQECLTKNARKGGLASSIVKTDEHRAASIAGLRRYQASVTYEQRMEIFRTGIGSATKKQLSEWGRKGATTANATRKTSTVSHSQ